MFRIVEWEFVFEGRIRGIPDETASGMREEGEHEEKRQMVGVPERLETLRPNFPRSQAIHEYHDRDHYMSSNPCCLIIMSLNSEFSSEFWWTQNKYASSD